MMEDQQRYVAVVELDAPGVISSSYTGPTGPSSYIGSTGHGSNPPVPPIVIPTQSYAPPPAAPPQPPPPQPPPAPATYAASVHSTIPPAQPGPGDYSTWNGNPVHVNVPRTYPDNTGPGDYSTWNGSAQPTIAPNGPVSVRTSTQPTINYTGHLGSSIHGPMLIPDGETPGILKSAGSARYLSEPENVGRPDDRYISRIIPSKEPILRPRDDPVRNSNRSSNISRANTDISSRKHQQVPNGLHHMVQLDINMTGSKTMTLGTSGNANGDIIVDGDVGKTGRNATITWGTIDEGDETKQPRLVDEINKDKDPASENKPFWPAALQEKKPRHIIFGVVLCTLLVLLIIAFIVVLVVLFAR